METKQVGLITAIKDYFGMLPGQTLSEFSQEVKRLNEADRAEIKAGLIKLGYDIA